MQIINVKIDELKEYEHNAKMHPRNQIEQIMKSIEEFGNNDPIAIDENNVIIEGHGRYKALKELGYKEVECIRLSHLTEEQKKAYILVHNKLTMNTDFDADMLEEELKAIDIDMTEFGFLDNEIKEIDNYIDPYKENERVRTNEAYNLHIYNEEAVTGKYDMPIIEKCDYIPKDLIGFNYAMSSNNQKCGIHFYIDDYQFERIWNKPEDYVELLEKYECILTPDFSLYKDMSMSLKIYNTFRSRLIGQYYQSMGMKVIPTISWCEKETFDFCFDGIEKNSVVSISTIGIKKDKEAFELWKNGVDEMIKRLEPKTILIYGGKVDYDFKNIDVRYYENKVTERMKEMI